ARQCARDIERADEYGSLKRDTRVGRQSLRFRQINSISKLAANFSDFDPTQLDRPSPAIKTNKRYTHRRAVHDPRLIAPGIKDAPLGDDAFEDFAVRTAPDRVRGHQ